MNDLAIPAAFTILVITVLAVILYRPNKKNGGKRIGDMPPLHWNCRAAQEVEAAARESHTDQWFRNATPAALAHFFENRTPLKGVYVFKLESRGHKGYAVHGHYMVNGYIRREFKGTTTADHGTERGLGMIKRKLAADIKAAPQWNY